MFNRHYPYLSSGSTIMRKHFEATARHFLETELTDPGDFIVELGCNDGVMLKVLADVGDPASGRRAVAERRPDRP